MSRERGAGGRRRGRSDSVRRCSFGGTVGIAGSRMAALRRLMLVVVALSALPVPAANAGWRVVEAESMSVDRGGTPLVAHGRYALGMRGGVAGSAQTLRGGRQIAVRVRGQACGGPPVVGVLVDGRLVMERAVTAGGWRRLAAPVRVAAGRHRLAVTLRNPGGAASCLRQIRVDWVALREQVPITAAVTSARLGYDRPYTGTFLRHFEGLTPENEMKWQFLEPFPGRFEFAGADQLVDFAVAHGLSVHGHALIFDKQLPQWLTAARPWSGGQLTGVIRGFVTRVVSRYRGRIGSWDVVNEPLKDSGTLGANVFTRVLGERYIEEAFGAARAADPAARLYVNEIGAEGMNRKSDALYALVKRLRERGVPIDGVGFQFHGNLGPYAPTAGEIRTNFKRFADLGLEIAVSEMDVRISDGRGDLAQRLAAQADVYGMVARACLELPACVRFTTWGFTDAVSWLGPAEHALPFYDDFVPKPAWMAITRELR
jgi:endo-1,4-beta-xylanase